MQYRTSRSDPLLIAEVSCAPFASGMVGITFCPGKCGSSVHGSAPWRRDLATDLQAIATWGASAVVTLVEPWELGYLQVPGLGEQVARLGMQWHHLPIVDVSVPGPAFVAAWRDHGRRLLARLQAGERILVHCRGGLGRAGTVAAMLLVDAGMAPTEALARVRRARPGAVETLEQERYVLAYPGTQERGPHPESAA